MNEKILQLAKSIMVECREDGEPITEEEALEMAKMELNAKEIKNYTQSKVEKKAKKPKERKIDNEKLAILKEVAETLKKIGFEPTMENEVALHFEDYTLKLIKHRAKK